MKHFIAIALLSILAPTFAQTMSIQDQANGEGVDPRIPGPNLESIKTSVNRIIFNNFVRFVDQKSKAFKGQIVLKLKNGSIIQREIGALQMPFEKGLHFPFSEQVVLQGTAYIFRISLSKRYPFSDDDLNSQLELTLSLNPEAPSTPTNGRSIHSVVLIEENLLYENSDLDLIRNTFALDLATPECQLTQPNPLHGAHLTLNLEALTTSQLTSPKTYTQLQSLHGLMPETNYSILYAKGEMKVLPSWVGARFLNQGEVVFTAYDPSHSCGRSVGFYQYTCRQTVRYRSSSDADSFSIPDGQPTLLDTTIATAQIIKGECACERTPW